MRPESRALLFDVQHAARGIELFMAGRSRAALDEDAMLRLAVERQFEIVGEALNRLRKSDPATAARITDVDAIVAFRNVLIHAYDRIDNAVTWRVVERHLPVLAREVEALLAAQDEPRSPPPG